MPPYGDSRKRAYSSYGGFVVSGRSDPAEPYCKEPGHAAARRVNPPHGLKVDFTLMPSPFVRSPKVAPRAVTRADSNDQAQRRDESPFVESSRLTSFLTTPHADNTADGSCLAIARVCAHPSSARAASVHSLCGFGIMPTRPRSSRSASQHANSVGSPEVSPSVCSRHASNSKSNRASSR